MLRTLVPLLALGLALPATVLPATAQTGRPAGDPAAPSPGAAGAAATAPGRSSAARFDLDPIKTDLGGMRASRIIGMPVYNESQEKIGSVDDIVIGADRALHVIISVGGFLGFDSKMVEVAYQKLQFSNAKGATNRVILPGATKQSLGAMQRFEYSRQG